MSCTLSSLCSAILRHLVPVRTFRAKLDSLYEKNWVENSIDFKKQLLIDVSVIIAHDARTGIQRFVRAIVQELLKTPPDGTDVRLVYATRTCGYHYAKTEFCLLSESWLISPSTAKIRVVAGDIFLALDLTANILPSHLTEIIGWKSRGASIHIVVYDLLPVLFPKWFSKKLNRNFLRWLHAVAIVANSAVCISKTVGTDLTRCIAVIHGLKEGTIRVSSVRPGSDIEATFPSKGLPVDFDKIMLSISLRPNIMMVGTLEPRKGHFEVVKAFEELWNSNCNVNLIIVGKPGWQTATLQKYLKSHPKKGVFLYWFDNASDEMLDRLYQVCTAVIVASHAEGYGLPVAEAIRYGKPVLARDLPVFQEFSQSGVTYFRANYKLCDEIKNWLATLLSTPFQMRGQIQKWEDTTSELLEGIGLSRKEGIGIEMHASG